MINRGIISLYNAKKNFNESQIFCKVNYRLCDQVKTIVKPKACVSNSTNYEGNITFSILNRNTASYQHCLRLNSNKPYSIINCDIKNNTVLNQFIFAESGEFTFKDCIIIKNNAVNTFYGVESSKSILIHCYLEINGTFEFVEIESLSASSFENELYFFKTAECNVEKDLLEMNLHSKLISLFKLMLCKLNLIPTLLK